MCLGGRDQWNSFDWFFSNERCVQEVYQGGNASFQEAYQVYIVSLFVKMNIRTKNYFKSIFVIKDRF